MADIGAGTAELPWPPMDGWLAAVRASPLLGSPPVLRVYHENLLYLDRYWREEQQVADDLLALLRAHAPMAVPDIGRLFPPGYEEQHEAAEIHAIELSLASEQTHHRKVSHGIASQPTLMLNPPHASPSEASICLEMGEKMYTGPQRLRKPGVK